MSSTEFVNLLFAWLVAVRLRVVHTLALYILEQNVEFSVVVSLGKFGLLLIL